MSKSHFIALIGDVVVGRGVTLPATIRAVKKALAPLYNGAPPWVQSMQVQLEVREVLPAAYAAAPHRPEETKLAAELAFSVIVEAHCGTGNVERVH